MRLIRVYACVMVMALNPLCHALAGSDETATAPAESAEEDDEQTRGNEEPDCD